VLHIAVLDEARGDLDVALAPDRRRHRDHQGDESSDWEQRGNPGA
jgi:hypothetical protein